jgi:hypothetical protein
MDTKNRAMSSIVNPNHPIPDDVTEGFHRLREEREAALGGRHEIAKLARPTERERKSSADAHGRAFNIKNVEDYLTETRDLRFESTARVRTQTSELLSSKNYFFDRQVPKLAPQEPQPPAPKPRDPTFWWADSHAYSSAGVNSSFEPDGLHFSGGFNRDDQSLLLCSFGGVARFELQWDRIPDSPSGRWTSAPHVELFGGLLAFTDAGNFWTGDCWSKCAVTRRQTILQFGLGGEVVRGEHKEEESLVDEDGRSRTISKPMPGFQPMPMVVFGGLTIGSVWAELEVRFDIQLEGNSFLWIDPAVLLLRTFQWPAVAI